MYIIEKSLVSAVKLLPSICDKNINRNYHFAFAFKKNKLLAIGTNNMSTESARVLKFVKRFKTGQSMYLYRHAEVDAISRLWGKTYIDYKIRFVILRINRFKMLGDSKPCENCAPILDSLGIDEIYWSNADGTFSSKNEKVAFRI